MPYAIVPSQGRYGSGEIVSAVELYNDLGAAQRRARRMTRNFQARMRRYGGTSGGYRVVEGERDEDGSLPCWRGCDLDRVPTAELPEEER